MSAAEDGALVVDAPLVAHVLPVVTARLCDRHPGVPAEIVEHHVKRAAVQLTGEARIPDYLPILIERRASESLRECRGLDPSAHAP